MALKKARKRPQFSKRQEVQPLRIREQHVFCKSPVLFGGGLFYRSAAATGVKWKRAATVLAESFSRGLTARVPTCPRFSTRLANFMVLTWCAH